MQDPLSKPGWRLRAVAGLEVGVVGGLAMFVLLLLYSFVHRQVWFAVPSLWGAVFYNGAALRGGPGRAVAAGLALHLFLSGLAGVLFAITGATSRKFPRALLVAVALSVGWHVLLYGTLLRRWSSFVSFYAPLAATIPAHALFAVGVFRTRARLLVLAHRLGEDAPGESTEG